MTPAFRARRPVRAGFRVAGETEAHWDNRYAAFVIKQLAGDPQPLAQAVAGTVIIRSAALVHAPAGSLPGDADAGGAAYAQNRVCAVGEFIGANPAGANFGKKL